MTAAPAGDGVDLQVAEVASGGRLVALRLFQYGPLFASSLIVARALGPVGRAEYALPLAAAWIAFALCHLSLGPSAVRLLGRGEASLAEITSHLAAAMLALSALGAAGTIGFGLVARSALANANLMTVALAAAAIPFLFIAQVAGQLIIAVGDIKAYSWSAVAGSVIQLGSLGIWLAAEPLKPESAMAITLIGFAATAIPMVEVLRRRAGAIALVPRVNRALGRRLLTNGLAMHPAGIALQLGTRLDLMIVGAVMSARSTGLYSLSLTLADSAFLATQTLSLSALHAQTSRQIESAVRYTTSFTRQTLALATVTALAASAVAYPFITLAFGEKWRGSVAPFVVLLVASVGLAIEEPMRQLLLRMARPLLISLAGTAGLALNAGATLALIPVLGVVGAALGSVVGYWCYAFAIAVLFTRSSGAQMSDIMTLPRRDDAVIIALRTASRRLGPRRAGASEES